jgi:hypothetical protein
VFCSGEANVAQIIPVERGFYELAVAMRAEGRSERGRLQINWSDPSGGHLPASIDVVTVSAAWERYSMIVETPPEAVEAVVILQTHDGSSVWFDQVSLRRVAPSVD